MSGKRRTGFDVFPFRSARIVIPLVIGLTLLTLRAGTPLSMAPEIISASSGAEVTLGSYAVVRIGTCTPGLEPSITIPQQRFHGVLLLKKGTMMLKKVSGCTKIVAPACIVVYRSNPGFTGSDIVAFDVANPITRQSHLHVFRINVVIKI